VNTASRCHPSIKPSSWRQSSPRNLSDPHLPLTMAMKRVSTIFRPPSSSAGPSSPEKLPAVVYEDDDSVSIKTAGTKSQQTTVTASPPPNLKIKVRPIIILPFCALTALPFHSASTITTRDGEVGSTRTPDPRLWPSRALSWPITSNGLDFASS